MAELEGLRRPEASAKSLTPTKTSEKKVDETSTLSESPTQGTASVIALQNSSSFNAIPSSNTGTTAASGNNAFNNSNADTPTVQKNLASPRSETNPPAFNANPTALSNKTASTGASSNFGANNPGNAVAPSLASSQAPSAPGPVLSTAANFSEATSPTTTKSPLASAPVTTLATGPMSLTSAAPEVRNAKIAPAQSSNPVPMILPALPNTVPAANNQGGVIADAGSSSDLKKIPPPPLPGNANAGDSPSAGGTTGNTSAAMVLAPPAQAGAAPKGGDNAMSTVQKTDTISVAAIVPRQDSGVPMPDTNVDFETPTLELKLEEISAANAGIVPPGLIRVKATGQVIDCYGKKSSMNYNGKILRIYQPLRHEFIEVAFDESSSFSFAWNIDPKSWNPDTKRPTGWQPYLLKKAASAAANPELRNKTQTCQGTAPECFTDLERADLERILILNPEEYCTEEPVPTLEIGNGGNSDTVIVIDTEPNSRVQQP